MKTLYRYRLTRLGFHFLFVALFGIVGGSLRGFNLLLLLAGLLISIVIVQWRQGRSMIRRTRVRRDPPRGVSAGETVSIAYHVNNLSRWLPLWAIQINDRIVTENSIAVPSEPNGFDDPIHLHASVGAVGPSQTARVTVDCRFAQRGHFELGPMIASTSFPFCLMNCERLTSGNSSDLFIYPRKISLARGWTALLPPRRGGDGNRSTGGTNHDGEFFGLRPWQSGDHVKHVHWRTTARIGEPAVRQFEQRNRHHVCVVVDGVPGERDDRSGATFESILQVAATMLDEMASESHSVTLVVADGKDDPSRLVKSSGADLTKPLERLAIATAAKHDESSAKSCDNLATRLADLSTHLREYDLVVISGRESQDFLAGDQAEANQSRAASVLRFFQRAGRLSWINVNAPASKRFFAEPLTDDGRREKSNVGF